MDNTAFDYNKLNSLLNHTKSKDVVFSAHADKKLVVVFSRHRFYKNLVVELAYVNLTKHNKLKNPIQVIDPLDLVWKTDNQIEIKFYTGISRFKNSYNEDRSSSESAALKAIIANPLQLEFYCHDENINTSLNASSLVKTKFATTTPIIEIAIKENNNQYTISGELSLVKKRFNVLSCELIYKHFIKINQTLYLIDNLYILNVIDFFKQHQNNLVLDKVAYEDFDANLLQKIGKFIKINYAYVKKASQKQLLAQGFDLATEQLIYLSESEDYVLLTPVVKYGDIEIPIISQQQIRAKDKAGRFFKIERDTYNEVQLIANIAKMHPYFKEQVDSFSEQVHIDYFYLHKKHFLDTEWFLNAFATWRNKGITILGFNQLKGNKYNSYQANIKIDVNSGIDWFETAIKIKFNQETVALKELHKSIRKKQKFVQLDDGTLGIIPEDWLKKFEQFFKSAEVDGEVLKTPLINYLSIEELYNKAQINPQTQLQIKSLKEKLANFKKIVPVPIPKALQATLRPYQQEGLNWLNFLDDFNFGGCLADDMGLGKTIQIIAFLLAQKEKRGFESNLIVTPASLVFNWIQEIKKFAPTLKTLILYGAERNKNIDDFKNYDVVLISYGTLLTDIKYIKSYYFNYIILDESQYIKNTNSLRYKAVTLLQSRNKLVLTGTPIENNTFDFYGQFSFACPGLLGSKTYFKEIFSVPIDQFGDKKRAIELQKRINPFLLRRTKQQVAKELPDKTEMIIYCEMDDQQREIYESCRTEVRNTLLGSPADELNKATMLVLQGITKLRQICDSPAIINADKPNTTASAKMNVLLEQIELKIPTHKILVFSQFVSMLNLIKDELIQRKIDYCYLTGEIKNRAEVVHDFQHNDSKRVFLISLKAGGLGLNLTKADYIYLIEPWWNPAVENQAIDRAYRIGQHKNVMAVRLICPNTIEDKMMLIQQRKKGLAQELIISDEHFYKSLTKSDLIDLLD